MHTAKFEVWGTDLTPEFADWLGTVTFMDFLLTVWDVGFAEAVNLVIAENVGA
jgi:hypothetical protein